MSNSVHGTSIHQMSPWLLVGYIGSLNLLFHDFMTYGSRIKQPGFNGKYGKYPRFFFSWLHWIENSHNLLQ